MRETKKHLNGIKNGIKETKREFQKETMTLVLGGLGLVAALAWNEAIQTLFETLFPQSNALLGKFIYATIITFIIVVLSIQLRKVFKNEE